MDSVVNIKVESNIKTSDGNYVCSSGSGVVIDNDGIILTNAHVVSDLSDGKITITSNDSIQYEGYVFSMDVISDLAIIKLASGSNPNGKLKSAVLDSNSDLRLGEWIIAVGSPLGLEHTVTVGVVSCTSRKPEEIGGIASNVEYIQTDCVIHSGSSGGPLVNLDGQIIGIVTTTAESNQGISFAIRIDNAIGIIQQMLMHKRVIRPWMGLKMVSLTPKIVQQLKNDYYILDSQTGIFVSNVVENSPACKSGIIKGDVIVAIDGIDVSCNQDILRIIGLRVGEEVSVTVIRSQGLEQDWDGRFMRHELEKINFKVKLEELDIFIS